MLQKASNSKGCDKTGGGNGVANRLAKGVTNHVDAVLYGVLVHF